MAWRSPVAPLARHAAKQCSSRRWPSAAVAVGVLLIAGRAPAYSLHLESNAPAGCADVDVLRGSVERLLGEPVLEERTFEALATVSADADARFTLTLEIRTPDGRGTRRVRADTCATLVEVAAFSIALALNPELALEPPNTALFEPLPEPPPEPPTPAPEPPPPGTPTPPRRDASPPRARSVAPSAAPPAPEIWGGAQALGDTSLLPSPAPGLRATADLVLGGRFRLGLGGLWLASRTKELGQGGGGLFSFWALEARACGQATLGVTAAVCPLFRFGELRGAGRDVAPRLTRVSRIYAPGVELLALYGVSSRVSATAGLAGHFPLIRDTFVINAGRVHQVPPVSVELSVGVAVRAW